jgi:Inhibitor of apoptosis-promoting Bax1
MSSSAPLGMGTIGTTYDDQAVGAEAVERDARELLGQVMGFVAVTVGFAALGAYLGRDLSGATGLLLFVAAFGAYGYATRRDLSSWGRTLFWALLGLIAFGIVAIFVSIPGGNIIYAVAGLGIFGAFTSIFLDIFNVFLLFLNLFGGSRE